MIHSLFVKIFIVLMLSLTFDHISFADPTNKDEQAQYSTKMDFDSSMIDGQMKAPSGFFLQGRNKQDLQSMVRLRANFRERLRNSRSAVKALVR